MNKKMSKRQRDLKSKLMAAICMLLVSSIMMVSTTYAWFTLSTAPEVTGITTAVGANGNLEMALLPVDGAVKGADNNYGITSGTADSMAAQDATKANITWGNLVDLGAKVNSENAYGLDKITLYPAAMNAQDGKLDTSLFLKTPVYGADGRVASLTANTFAGVYTGSKFSMTGVNAQGDAVSNPTGVRAIGTVSSMSDQEIAFRAAQSAASGLAVRAQTAAAKALEDNGDGLASIAILHFLEEGKETYTAEHIDPLKAMTSALLAKGDASGNGRGAIPLIEDAIKQYVWAYHIANNANYEEARASILDAADITSLLTYVPSDSVYATMINKLVVDRDADAGEDGGTKGIAAAALEDLEDLGTSANWEAVSGCLTQLASTELMTINGSKVEELTPGVILAGFMNGGLSISLPSGSGVFADVADHVGNYGASISVDASAVDASITERIPATMTTATSVSGGGYQGQAKTHLAGLTLQGSGAAADSVTDVYGYVIDLAFRTNAAGSSLRLQSEAADRLYTDAENAGKHEETMGHGSSMTFVGAGTFENNSVKNLMKSIRIIFFDPADGTILCYGYLDENKIDYTNGVKMNMHLSSTNPKDGVTAIENDTIMALNQNQAERLSVLVYLDGETVENKDVAFDAAMSMSGSINLQFSSSAKLEPMQYTNLAALDGSGNNNNGNVQMPETVTASATDGYTASGYYLASENKVGATIVNADGKQVIGGTVTINGKPATYTTIVDGVVSGWVADNADDATDKPASLTITVENAQLAPTTFTVTSPSIEGVTFTGDKSATENTAYSFTLVNSTDKEYTVSYKIGESTVALTNLAAKGAEATEDVTGSYTIENTAVTGNIEIIIAEA